MGWNPFKAIGDAISSVGKGIVNVITGVVKAVGNIVSSVINFVVQPFMGLLGGLGGVPDAASEAERQQGVLISAPAGGDFNVPVVYGLRQIGAKMVYFETGRDNNKYLWVCYVLSEGPIEGLYDISIDDEDVTTGTLISNLNAGAQWDVDKAKSRYSGKTRFQFWNGGLFAPADYTAMPPYVAQHLMKEAPSWKNSNIMNGTACLLARYEMKKATTQNESDNNPFRGSIPQIKVTVLGRKIASLVAAANQEAAEWGVYPSGYTERYSTNPAEILLDYLRNPYYGKGLANNEIDWDSFRKAALKFNQTVTYVDGYQGPILTANIVLETGSTLMSNTKILLQGMRSYMPYVNGKYKLKVEDAGNETDILSGVATIVATYNKDNIVSDITYGGIDRSSKYTAVEITYVSPADKWANQTITYPTTEDERLTYVAADGGRENKGSFTFPTLTNYAMAYDMARLIFEKSRIQQTCSFTGSLQAMEIEPGDNIYIEGSVLDFVSANVENVPWRVVSTKLNSNYTYQLDCVRNPDYIYPHARAGEKDIVLATYIPRGAFIYYPYVNTDLSLRPPGNAFVLPGQTTGNLVNSTPTNPTGVSGGGVGNSTGPTAPPEPPPAGTLDTFIQVDKVTYTVSGALVTATIEFKQPDHTLYSGVDLWYKRNISTETVYRTDSNTQLPGANQVVRHTITGLVKGQIPYILLSRVKYSTGDSSSVVVRTPLNVSGAVSTENPEDYEQLVGPGWTVGGGANDPNPKDTIFSKISAIPTYASAGVPTSNRGLVFTIRQDINIKSFNSEVAGVNIFYKNIYSTYWYKHTETFNGSYFPGVDYSFTPTLSLGTKTHPSIDDASDNFNFVFRFFYKDGTESTLQSRTISTIDIENTTAADVFYGALYAGSGQESTTSFAITTVDQAPPGAVVNTRDMKITFTAISASRSISGIVFGIEPPVISDRVNWVGVRVLRRIAGAASATDTVDFTPVSQPTQGIFEITVPITYDANYEYVIVPLVTYLGTVAVCSKAWYVAGAIHNRQTAPDYPSTGNWAPTLTQEYLDYSAAVAKFGTIAGAGTRRTTNFATIVGATLLTGGVPRTPRAMNVTITQDMSSGVNGNIKGVKCYYKLKAATYWSEATHTFAGYTEGTAYTFAFPGSLGAPSYPSAPGANDDYDFVFRYVYTDDSESLFQTRFMGASVERDLFNAYSFNPFAQVFKISEVNTAFTFATEGEAPPGAVGNPLLVSISMYSMRDNGNVSPTAARIFLTPPAPSDLSYFVGVRVVLHKVTKIADKTAPFTTSTVDFTPVTISGGIYSFLLPLNYYTMYELVVVPLVLSGGVTVESTKAWYLSGFLHNLQTAVEYPSNSNWYGSWVAESYSSVASARAQFGRADPLPTRRDTHFANATGVPLLTGGVPRQPRELSLTLTQSLVQGINGKIKGFKIYYKPTDFAYWYTASHTVSSYTEGTAYTFTFPGFLGLASYPSDASANASGNNKFDFIFRFFYDDELQTESLWQYRILGARVEVGPFGGYSFDPFSGVSKVDQLIDATNDPVTVDKAPPGAIPDPRDMRLGIPAAQAKAASANGLPNRVVFNIDPPVAGMRNLWYGARLRYRILGAAGVIPFTTVDIIPVPFDNLGQYFFSQAIDFNRTYEYIITPLVYYGGTMVEAASSWRGQGSLLADQDAKVRLNLEVFETAKIAESGAKVFVTDSLPNVTGLVRFSSATGTYSTFSASNQYYLITIDTSTLAPQGTVNYRIYHRSATASALGDGVTQARYYGLGRWEYIDVDGSNSTVPVTGLLQVKLRLPVSFNEYNRYYGVPGYTTTPLKNTSVPWDVPVGGTGKILLNINEGSSASTSNPSNGMLGDVVIVATINGNAPTKGRKLPQDSSPLYTGYPNGTSNILTVKTCTDVVLSSLNGFAVGSERNLTDARPRIAFSTNTLITSNTKTAYALPTSGVV